MISDFTAALHAMLTTHPEVVAVLGDDPPIYEHVPEGQKFPYVTYGRHRSEDISADGAAITAHTVRIAVWSGFTGRAEILAITEAVEQAIRTGDIPLPSGEVTSRRIGLTETFTDPSYYSRNAVIRARFIIDMEADNDG